MNTNLTKTKMIIRNKTKLKCLILN